jgi:hypothetical protein
MIIIIIILPFKSNLWLFFKINDIFFKFLNYDINNINYNKNIKIYNTNNNILILIILIIIKIKIKIFIIQIIKLTIIKLKIF